MNKKLENSRALGRLASNTVIVFGTAVLVAHSAGQDFICGVFSEDGGFFTAIVAAAFGLWSYNLWINLCEQQEIGNALETSGTADAKKILSTNVQWKRRRIIFKMRLIIVAVLIVGVWAATADVFSDPWGKSCIRSEAETGVGK